MNTTILLAGGFIIGIFSVVVGAGMFFSIPLLQLLFPQASFGVLVGNIKVGSFFRSIGSTISTHKHIDYLENIKISALAFVGTIIGASTIANLSQEWLLPAVIIAALFTLLAPRLAGKITNKTFSIASFLTGIYAGLFGAGIGLILVALLRLKHPADESIAHVKIQARFVEWLLTLTAIATHILHGNIVSAIWIPWSIGGLAGGYIGGILLHKMGTLPGYIQKYVLCGACILAITVATIQFVS